MAISSSMVSLLSLVGLYAILAIGLNIKFGYTGLIEIGHVVFYLIGAYTTALLVAPPAESQQFATYILGFNWPWLPALAVGTLVAGIAGVLIALPAIRLREDYLAIVMLGFSFIGLRLTQTERWFANGPDSLSSFSVPLAGAFPLPGDTPVAAVTLGAVVFLLWFTATYALVRLDILPSPTGRRGKVVHGIYAVATLGIGYLGARLATRDETPDPIGPAVASGLVAGLIATVGSLASATLGELVVLTFFGLASLFSWLLAASLLVSYTSAFSRRDLLTSLGVTTGFVVSLLPAILGFDQPGTVGLLAGVATLGLFAAYLYWVRRLVHGWATASDTPFISVLGAAAIWLFLFRYFVVASIGPFFRRGLAGLLVNTIENVLWLVAFAARGPTFDYARFLLIGIFLALAFVYFVAQRVVDSPYGRVLKAIREDEEVATALGKSAFTYKVQSMAVGSMMAGLAGGLTAIFFQTLTYNMFHPRVTFFVFLVLIIGGTANNKGMILGALVYWGFQKGTTDLAALFPAGELRTRIQAVRLMVFGLLFVFLLYYRPEGLLGEERMGSEGEQ